MNFFVGLLLVLPQQAAADQNLCLDQFCFILKAGSVFEAKKVSSPLGRKTNFNDIVAFKTHLFAKDNDGTISMWTQDSACWVELAMNIKKWSVDEHSLFLIDDKDRLLVYYGDDYTFLRIEDSEKTVCSAGQVFKTTKFKNVIDIKLSENNAEVILKNKKSEHFYKKKRMPAGRMN